MVKILFVVAVGFGGFGVLILILKIIFCFYIVFNFALFFDLILILEMHCVLFVFLFFFRIWADHVVILNVWWRQNK